MKKLILAIVLFAFYQGFGQITVVNENFETLPISLNNSGNSNWSRTSIYSASGIYSDSARIVVAGDSAILTSQSFSTLGFPTVLLQFDQIAKLAYGDVGTVEYSVNNGTSWNIIPVSNYLGSGVYSAFTGFNSLSYAIWDPANNNSLPTSLWWIHENFDISSIVGNQAQVKIRFKLKDTDNNGGFGAYGWLLDNIHVAKSISELVPPSINLISPIVQDSVYHTGPFDIYASVMDASGVKSVKLIYSHGALSDTIPMVKLVASAYKAVIPSFGFDSTFCYKLIAVDSSLSQNTAVFPASNCITVYVKRPQNVLSIGLGTATINYAPVHIDNSATTKYSNYVGLYTASELGFSGTIKSLSWTKNNTTGFSGANNVLKIYVKHTSSTSVTSPAANFANELVGATLVYENLNQDIPLSASEMKFIFNKANFNYDGSSNLMVLVDWYHPTVSAGNVSWQYTPKAGQAITYYGATANPSTSIGSNSRPNIKIYYDTIQFNYNTGVTQIVNPTAITYGTTNTDFKVRFKNYGMLPVTKVQINWSFDSIVQTPYIFTGNILPNLTSNDVTIGSKLVLSGLHKLKVWTSLPNDSLDANENNDSLSLNYYHCNQALSGNYTIGSAASADFHSIGEVANVLKNCGVVGHTVFNILPGTYNERVSFDSIVGLDSSKTVTFQSSTLNADDVIIQGAGSSGSDYIVRFAMSNYISLKYLTIKNTSITQTTAISLINSSNQITIKNCKLFSYRPTADAQAYSLYSYGDNDYLTLENNEISGGHYGVFISGQALFADSVRIINNKIYNSYRVLVSINGTKSLLIKGNTITGGHLIPAGFAYMGVDVTNSTTCLIEKNTIRMENQGPTYGLNFQTCVGLAQIPNKVYNNFIIVNGSSTSSSVYGIHLNGTISHLDMYNNSISLNVSGGYITSAVYYEGISSSSVGNINFVNNAVANFSGGNGLNVTASSVTYLVNSKFDYNSYYSNGGACVNWGGTSFSFYQPISSLTAISLRDSNSMFANPKFYNFNNLHSFSPALNNKGVSIAGLSDDFDGDLRSVATPDIGADEFSISSIDAGIIQIVQPLSVDTQNRVVQLRALVQNFGSSPITTIDAKYKLNNGGAVSTTWTGNLASGAIDTINFGSFTIPTLNYSLKVYTTLTGDTLKYNDTTSTQLFGLPLVNLFAKTLLSPISGCDKTSLENVKVRIINQGVGTVLNGASVSYKTDGMTSAITENITTPIAPGDSIDFTFASKINMFVGYTDSIFNLKVYTSHASDPFQTNDTIGKSISSLGLMPSPIVSDTTINYGTSAYLSAQATGTVGWYQTATSASPLSTSVPFATPLLFDTTTYYAMVQGGTGPQIATIGNGTNANGQYGIITPYGPAINGTSRQQYLFLASELQAMGLSAGNITSLSFNLDMVIYTDFTPWELKIGTTTESSYTTNFFNGATSVYSGSITVQTGWNEHLFSSPFYWDGTSNLFVEVCTPGKSLYASPVRYTTTSFNSVLNYGAFGTGACSNTTGSISTDRPNIRFKTSGLLGCTSLRVPVNVNVILPAKDLNLTAIVNPVSDCNIASSAVSIKLVNMGTDTIPAGFTAAYKINNGAYTTPSTVNSSIAPADTLIYTFPTLASLPTGTNGLKYKIRAVVMVPNDSYALNDSVASDSIFSKFTPTSPIVTNITVPYGQNTILTATATDTVFWFSDLALTNQLGYGSSFNVGAIFDTTIFYATGQRMTPLASYTLGVAKGVNPTNSGPSPYGAYGRGSKNQFLIRASELRALGIQKGQIQSLSFNVQGVKGAILENYSISIGQTSADSLTSFVSNLTTVYNQIAYTEVAGWNTHNFTSPFVWDGSSNLVIQTCFKNYSSVVGYAQVIYDSLSYNTSAVYDAGAAFDCGYSDPDFVSHLRPIMKFSAIAYGDCQSVPSELKVSVSSFPNIDGGLTKIHMPTVNLLNTTSSDVKVILKNFGLSNLTNASISWTENGVSQNTFNWTGLLQHGQTDTVTIKQNHVFAGGPTKIKVLVTIPSDAFMANDSAVVNINVCMHDTFKIGPTQRFTNFNQAISALYSCGICGPVVFLVDSANYNEQLFFTNIVGSSPQNTITFMGASSDSTHARLSYITSQTSNYVVQFKNTSNIIFKKLTISANAALYANVVCFTGNTSNITIENCVVNSAQMTSNNQNIVISNIYGEGPNIKDIYIRNNVLKFAWSSVYFNGTTTTKERNIQIIGNKITNFGSTGVYLYYTDSTQVLNNIIVSNNSESYYYGIRLMQSGVTKIGGNKIHLLPTLAGYGIYPWSTTAYASNPSLIYNNTVSLTTGNGDQQAIFAETCGNMNIVFNSVNIISGSNISKALRIQNGSSIKVLNNSLVNHYGYTIYANNPAALVECNNNNYHTSPLNTQNFAFWSSAKTNLSNLKASDPSKNVNSISINPIYYAAENLHVYSPLLNTKAIPFAGISTDIDGQARNTTTPDIGADEYTPANNDIGVTEFLNPINSGCSLSATDSVKVRLFYFGSDTLHFAVNNVLVQVNVSTLINSVTTNSVLNKTLNTGFLAPAEYLDVVVANNFNLSAKGRYIFNAKTVWALDTNYGNDGIPPVTVYSYPEINSFPYNDGFESGVNLSFIESKGVESNIAVDNSAASSGTFGLHMMGGQYNGWGSGNTITNAFLSTSHVSKAYTCNVNASSAPFLSLSFDLKQTNSSTSSNKNSWFRVMITPQGGTPTYLLNSNGDSAFYATTQSADPFTTQTFNLNSYAGTNFTLSLEAANCYAAGAAGSIGDNVYIDNFSLYIPQTADVLVKSFVNMDPANGKNGLSKSIKISIQNIGTDSVDSIPVAYRIDNGSIYRDTIYNSIAPNAIDTIQFTVPFTIANGIQQIIAFSELPIDASRTNDTLKINFKGMKTYNVDYFDNFDLVDDWYAQGFYDQWELGSPNKVQINAAASAPNAWVTKLVGPYVSNGVEYLYSPYITIPVTNDTATLEFLQNMSVIATKAYGKIQFSFDNGNTWNNAGYIGDPNTTNWYNTNINGMHVWSSTTGGWISSSMKLDPTIFNTGNPFCVRFMFKSEANQVVAEGWAIDNFKVSIKLPAIDLGVTAIEQPTSHVVMGDSITVKVRLKNFGSDTITNVPVSYAVDGVVIANETWMGVLTPAEDTVYTFIQKFKVLPSSAKLCAFTKKIGDANLTNDTSCINLIIDPAALDAGIVQIIAPVGIASTIYQNTVKVKIKNFGSTTLTSIPVSYSRGITVIANETYTGSLAPGATVDYTFASSFMSLTGNYQLCAKTNLVNDAYNVNDVSCVTLTGSGIEETEQTAFFIKQNIPNPTTGKTSFSFIIPTSDNVKISVLNLLGQVVYSENIQATSGENVYEMDLTSLNSGVYYYTVEYKDMKRVKKLAVSK